MKKILTISSVLLGVVFLAGCGQKNMSQTQSTSPTPVAQKQTQPPTDDFLKESQKQFREALGNDFPEKKIQQLQQINADWYNGLGEIFKNGEIEYKKVLSEEEYNKWMIEPGGSSDASAEIALYEKYKDEENQEEYFRELIRLSVKEKLDNDFPEEKIQQLQQINAEMLRKKHENEEIRIAGYKKILSEEEFNKLFQ